MRDRQTYTFEELRREAQRLITKHGLTQEEVGARLTPPVKGPAISRALNSEDESKYPGVLQRIVAALSDFEIRREVTFRAHKKATG